MKILLTNFHKADGGGHVAYIMELAKALSEGHEVTVASPATSVLLKKVAAIENARGVAQDFTSHATKILQGVSKLRALIADEAFDVVHVNGAADHRHVMLACLGLKHRPKIIWTKHNTRPANSWSKKLRADHATDWVISVCKAATDVLMESVYRNLPISTIGIGVDTDYHAPASDDMKAHQKRKWLGDQSGDKIVLGSVAGTDYEKGWLDLLRALDLLSEHERGMFRVILPGGELSDRTRRELETLQSRNILIQPGFLTDVRTVLAACDAGFVLSYDEGISCACREMMASGLPVLATRIGGLPENIDDRANGWLVPAHSPEAIRQILETIMNDAALTRRMGRAARLKSENEFSIQQFADSTLDVYRSALAI